MKYSTISFCVVAALAATVFTGCAESISGNTFSRDEARMAQEMYEGTVVDVREGKVEGDQSGIGAVGGAAMGGVVGNLFGGGKGNTIATVGGAIAGGLAGNAVEKGVTGHRALQITVKLDTNGKNIVVTQGTDINFVPGQRVRVIVFPNGGHSRVQPL